MICGTVRTFFVCFKQGSSNEERRCCGEASSGLSDSTCMTGLINVAAAKACEDTCLTARNTVTDLTSRGHYDTYISSLKNSPKKTHRNCPKTTTTPNQPKQNISQYRSNSHHVNPNGQQNIRGMVKSHVAVGHTRGDPD